MSREAGTREGIMQDGEVDWLISLAAQQSKSLDLGTALATQLLPETVEFNFPAFPSSRPNNPIVNGYF
jgi:hypothetical protein